MRTTRRLLVAFVLTLVFVAVLVVTAFAAMPTGATANDELWPNSSTYDDIENPENGWVFYTTTSAVDPLCRVQAGAETTTFVKAPGGVQFYYNKALKTGVLIANGEMAGDSGDANVVSLTTFSKTVPLAYFIEAQWANIVTHFASNDTPWSKSTGSTTYPTTIGGTSMGGSWTTAYLLKSDYEALASVFAEIDADTTKTDDEKKIAKVTAATEYSTRYQNKNIAEEGALWTLGYLFKLMAADPTNYPLETLEFRVKKGATNPGFQNFGYVLLNADSVQTIYIDSRMDKYAAQPDADRGLFQSLSKLKSLGHVVYEDYSGTFKTDVDGATFEENKVIIKGLTKRTQSTNHQNMFGGSSSMTYVEWFETLVYSGTEIAGTIPAKTFENTTALTTLTIPATVELKAINASAFKNSGIATIDVKGTVASDMVIDKTAFSGATSETVQIIVYDVVSEMNIQKAIAAASLGSKVEVVNESPLKNPIIAEGFQFRIHNYSGLRSIFTLDASVVLENGGAEKLKDYGVVTFTEKVLNNVYGGDLSAVLFAALNGNLTEDEAKQIRLVSVMEANRFVEVFEEGKTADDYMYADAVGDKTFCITLTNIPDQNVTDAVYSVAYSIWNTDNGGTDYSFTIYESENEATLGKQAYSLYDVTIYAFANGLVNTETVTDEKGNVWQCCLWDVLDNGAVPYEGNIDSTNKTDPANYDNPTHYLNNPLYAFSNYDALWGSNGNNPILEETSTTNVTWSILKYNGKYIAVYRDAGGDGPSLLPGIWYEWKVGTHPFNPKYALETAKTPTVGWGVYNNLTTLVIDYGVEGVAINGDVALGAMPNVTTIVYPNGFDEIHHYKRDWGKDANDIDEDGNTTEYLLDLDGDGELYDGDVNKCLENLFYDNSKLTDVIWANNDGIPHMQDFKIAEGDTPMKHLYDLRGMGRFSSNGKGTFSSCKLMENVVFGAIPGREIYNGVFTAATALERAWYELEHTPGTIYEAPLMKTIDIGRMKGNWGNLEGNVFGLKSNGYTIVLPQKIAEGAAYTYTTNSSTVTDTFFGGDTSLTVKIVVVDSDRNIIDPSAAAAKLTTRITDTTYTNRVYFYYPDTDTYKNPAGTAFAG